MSISTAAAKKRSSSAHRSSAPEGQVAMLGEKPVLIFGLVAEQRKRLGIDAATGDNFGPPAGDEVERGVILEHANGVRGAKDGDGTRELDAPGLRCDGGKDHRGRRHREVEPVMFADGENVESRLVGEPCLRQHFGDPFAGREVLPGYRVRGDIAKAIDAEFHEIFPEV
jgi:hypothetical protein